MQPGGFHASEPMELWVIDCVTHLPESDGNVLLLTCVDVFTKLVVAIPLPNEKSETVGRALQRRLFSVHGYPRLLLSDRAKGFVSDGLKWLCKHLGVVKINTTGLLPTGASPVERFHRGLGASLTIVCNKAKKDWAFMVDSVTFAYNISVNESTGHSPFYLSTGRHPNLPIEVLTGLKSASVQHKDHKFVENMTTALNEAYQFVRQRQLATLERNQKVQLHLRASATIDEVEKALAMRETPGYQENELVSYWVPEIADKQIKHKMPKKFQYRWEGPYNVTEKYGDHYYIVRKGVKTLVNPGRLRKYHLWAEDSLDDEANDEPPDGTEMDIGEPKIGDLIAISLNPRPGSERPFAVGKILNISNIGAYEIHWYGNSSKELEGTYRPEWRRQVNKTSTSTYYAEDREEGTQSKPFTTQTAKMTIKRNNIQHFGFKLQYNDRLPVPLLRAMNKNPKIKWTKYKPPIPRE